MIMQAMKPMDRDATAAPAARLWIAEEPPAAQQSEVRAVESFVSKMLATAEESASNGSYVAARRRILRDLDRYGPQTISGMPRSWPVTTQHVRTLVRELEADRLIERVRGTDGPDLYRLTPNGTRALAATRRTQLELIANLLHSAAVQNAATAVPAWRTLRAALEASEAAG